MTSKKKATEEAAIPIRERLVCSEECRIKGVHYFPGDQVAADHPDAEALTASGAFKKA